MRYIRNRSDSRQRRLALSIAVVRALRPGGAGESAAVAALMDLFGWTEVWFPTAGDEILRRRAFYIGNYDNEIDLCCVRYAETNEDGMRWLSPKGPTMLTAALRSVAKRYATEPLER